MKSRLLPDSLLGQLILVTLLGIIMMQGVNYFTVCTIQTSYRSLAEKTRAESTAAYYLLLNGMTQAERQRAAKSLTPAGCSPESGLRVSLLAKEPDWTAENTAQSQNALALLQHSLSVCGVQSLGHIHTRLIDKGSVAATLSTALPDGPLLQIALQLDDGEWIAVTQPLFIDDQKVVWTQRLMVFAELLLFGALIIALLMRVTRPLCRMSHAAEAFGRHPEGECPLPEDGSAEVREAAQSFNRMRERILDTLAERRRMLAAMGHDLRTPLARAILRLEEIEPEALREKFAANLTDIQSIVEQGLELAGSLNTSEEPVRLDIHCFVESLVDDAVEQGSPVSLRTPLNTDSKPLILRARPLCLKRSLENLLTNAVFYGGGAQIEVSNTADSITIDIIDKGPGIPQEQLEKVFEPYYRLETSRNRNSGGTGLGLSIARNMASLNNGRLTLENLPEGGLRARLVFPRT